MLCITIMMYETAIVSSILQLPKCVDTIQTINFHIESLALMLDSACMNWETGHTVSYEGGEEELYALEGGATHHGVTCLQSLGTDSAREIVTDNSVCTNPYVNRLDALNAFCPEQAVVAPIQVKKADTKLDNCGTQNNGKPLSSLENHWYRKACREFPELRVKFLHLMKLLKGSRGTIYTTLDEREKSVGIVIKRALGIAPKASFQTIFLVPTTVLRTAIHIGCLFRVLLELLQAQPLTRTAHGVPKSRGRVRLIVAANGLLKVAEVYALYVLYHETHMLPFHTSFEDFLFLKGKGLASMFQSEHEAIHFGHDVECTDRDRRYEMAHALRHLSYKSRGLLKFTNVDGAAYQTQQLDLRSACGFIKGVTTLGSALRALGGIRDHHKTVILSDIEGAFDSVNYRLFMDNFHIPEYAKFILDHCLSITIGMSPKDQKLIAEGHALTLDAIAGQRLTEMSPFTYRCSGLPQGSIVSPQLLNLVYAPWEAALRKWDPKCVLQVYADDLIYISAHEGAAAMRLLELALLKGSGDQQQFTVSAAKTHTVTLRHTGTARLFMYLGIIVAVNSRGELFLMSGNPKYTLLNDWILGRIPRRLGP